LKECTLPLTAVNAVDLIVTEMGVIEITDVGFVLIEQNPEYSLEEIQAATGAELTVSLSLKQMV
jgi:acetate CoA/acetoacetate CoA-transferase beta subunit